MFCCINFKFFNLVVFQCFPTVPFVPIYDISITDGDIRRLWSCNSTKGDRYIQITDQIVPAGTLTTFNIYRPAEREIRQNITLSDDILYDELAPRKMAEF